MIKFLQKGGKTQKWMFIILLGLVCISMVWYLVPGGMGDDSPQRGDIAKVGDESVTVLDVEQSARQMGRQQFRGQAVPEQLMPYLMQRAADQLITQKALTYEAKRVGFQVTADELSNFLHQGEFGAIFFPEGKFIGEEAYENAVQNYMGMGVKEFEDRLRAQLLLQKLFSMVGSGIDVSDAELNKEYTRQNVKVKLQYALLTNADMEKLIKPTDDELRKYYDQNKSRYAGAIPEKRKASYIVIDRQKVLDQAKQSISNDQLLAWYNSHQSQYATPESIDVSHILIKTPPPGPDGKVDKKAEDEARAKAQDVLKQVRSGGNFAELAKKYSDDPGSKDKGGEYKDVTKNTGFDPKFMSAAEALQPGQVSDLVQTVFGFHIIKLDARRPAGVKPFNEVKDQIAQQMSADKAASDLDALAARVQSQARTEGIDKAAAANKLQAYHSEWFTRTDSLPGLGNSAEFTQAAFTAKVNSNPDTVKVPTGDVVFLVTEDQPAKTPTFEEWRSHVEKDFKSAQATALLAGKSHELADRAHALHDLSKAAKEEGATIKTSDFVKMSDQAPDLGSMSGPMAAAFDMQPGQISDAIDTGAGAVVFTVLEKQQPTAEEFSKGKDQMREQILQQKKQERLNMFIADVRNRMQKEKLIRINQDELKRLTGPAGSPLTGM